MDNDQQHDPANRSWERVAAFCGIGAAILVAVELLALSAFPSVDSSTQAVVQDLGDNYALSVVLAYTGVLVGLLLIPFFVSMASLARRFPGVPQERWMV